jgi:predicted nucleotidyltransferase
MLKRDAILYALVRHLLSNARVFGSSIHGVDHERSNLDIVVDAASDVSLIDTVRAQRERLRTRG